MPSAVAVGSLIAQWQRFEISNLIRKMLCKMPPNNRLTERVKDFETLPVII